MIITQATMNTWMTRIRLFDGLLALDKSRFAFRVSRLSFVDLVTLMVLDAGSYF